MSRITKKISSFTRSDIAKLLKNAQLKLRIKGVRVLAASSSLPEFGRILMIIPRRSGNSPQRNLIRRRLKSIFREEKLCEKLKDIVVIVRSEGINTPFDALRTMLVEATN